MQSKYLATFEKLMKEGVIGLQGDRILIELLKEEERKTTGGIILPETESDKFRGDKAQFCKVLAVGPGKLDEQGRLIKVSVQAGDTIMVNQYQVKWLKDFGGVFNFKEGTIGLIEEEAVHICVFDINRFQEIIAE